MRQIHDTIGGSIGTIHRELGRLEASGIVVSESSGNRRFYAANRRYPLRRELAAAVRTGSTPAGGRELRFIAADKVPLGMRSPLPHLTPQESAALERATSAARAVFGSELLSTTVYGSKVRGDFGPESDIDILVVIREKDWQRIDLFFDVIVAIELDYPVRLSAKIMTQHEYRANKKLRSPFIEEVEREGVAV